MIQTDTFHRIPREALKLYFQVVDHITNRKLDLIDVSYLTREVFSVLIKDYQHNRRIVWEMESQQSMYNNLWASEE